MIMFFIFGWNHEIVTSYGPVQQHICKNCNNTEFWQLNKISRYFTLFFIPIFPHGSDNWYFCPICNCGIKLEPEMFIYHKSIAEINTAFMNKLIDKEERQKQLEDVYEQIDKINDEKQIKYIEESKSWKDQVVAKTDSELLDILNNSKNDYNPAFVIALEEEVKKRNLN